VTTNVVVGVDGSLTAERAARTAAGLAQTLGAELHVVTAYAKFEVERVLPETGAEDFSYTTEQQAERVAGRVARALRRDHPGLQITSLSWEGNPASALVEVASRRQDPLIVVGNKRVQGISRVLGSVARGVLTKASCDVYVAHTAHD
jgi:nucleotide-binding universal stress UspA family protein